MSNFYKKILLKMLGSVKTLKSATVRDHAKRLRKTATSNEDDVYKTADMLMRIAGLLTLVEWVYSEKPPEELDK